jgi:serine/threonine-protein kinase
MSDPDEALREALAEKYELLEVLGEGGMGTVYMARDRRHGRQVAVKTIRPDSATPQVRDRFEREIQITANFQHPNILPLLDSGMAGETLYYIMPFVEGESLRDRLARVGTLPAEGVVGIGRDVASALDYAHGREVVHRDIKPANILLTSDRAVVADFGISKAVGESAESALTRSGAMVGTPAYMPPEQFTGEVTGRGDIYALGAVLYEALTGRKWSLGVAVDQADWDGVDPEVRAALSRALEPSPEGRWEDAAAFRRALGQAAALHGAKSVIKEVRRRSLWQLIVGYGFGSKVGNLFSELRRRRVLRVATVYAVAAWLAIQIGEATFPAFGIPDWAMRLLVVLAILGFPIAVVLAWAFDLTPRGVERTPRLLDEARVPASAESGGPSAARSPQAAVEPPSPDPHPHSIAVLPFANLSADVENEYFSDGITEDLIAHLARVRDLKVISRTSVMQYKQQRAKSGREIGRELDVATLLEGSVRRAEGHVRIVAQLVDARTDHHLWSETYDRELENIFEIQADVARRIASSLRMKLTPREQKRIVAPPTRNLEAYDLYLRGRHEWNQRSEANLERSLDYLSQAVSADPEFALAFAGLADCYLTIGIYGTRPPQDVMPSARAAAEKALEIDGEQAEALTALACVRAVYEWDWKAAEEDFRHALNFGPNYPLAPHWYASNLLVPLRRFEEARAELERARELDPLAPSIATSLAILDFYRGRFEAASEACQGVIATHPAFWLAHYFSGLSHLQLEKPDEAIAAFERASDLSASSVDAVAALGCAYGLSGRWEEAREVLRALTERAERGYVSPIRLAQLHLALGEKNDALCWLERALVARCTGLIWLDVQPIFQVFREEPRFRAIRDRVLG